MKHVSVLHMQEVDRAAIRRFGIPAMILMENAGRSAASVAIGMLKRAKNRRVIVVCGGGNNGGDGFVCARHLLNRGFKVAVFVAADPGRFTPETQMNFDILLHYKGEIKFVHDASGLKGLYGDLAKCGLIIDALLGIGLTGTVRPLYAEVITAINSASAPVLSLDVPSGLDADSGKILGDCVKARSTVTFGLPKKGMKKKDGPKMCGTVVVADISLPPLLLR